MKLQVFSDSHRYLQGMLEAVERENPDMVLHLGDLCSDAETLSAAFPTLPVVSVPGNCDGWTDKPAHRLLELEGRRILMGHGHEWQVKLGYEKAVKAACDAGADILLFGHTHVAHLDRRGPLWMMNPGAQCVRGAGNYGIIVLENGTTLCYTVTD